MQKIKANILKRQVLAYTCAIISEKKFSRSFTYKL